MQYQDNLWMADCKYCCLCQMGYSTPHPAPSPGSSSGMLMTSAYAKRKIIHLLEMLSLPSHYKIATLELHR